MELPGVRLTFVTLEYAPPPPPPVGELPPPLSPPPPPPMTSIELLESFQSAGTVHELPDVRTMVISAPPPPPPPPAAAGPNA
ncbi:hypothetical protein C4556_02305 [Candidatus Parcubacteria bacterium]|nr:MAG: hypothetical protein C4556_02305 [Candidatus Parcubacteria bacterium]